MGMEEEYEELKKLMWLKTMRVITPLGGGRLQDE